MSKLTFLGTGTSGGVPMIGCECEVCRSGDHKDKRLRTSAYIRTGEGTCILIDAGTDFRQQALTYHIRQIDGLLFTHSHHDHIGGIDELRQINMLMKSPVSAYANRPSIEEIKERFSYIFKDTPQKGGGKPQIILNEVKEAFKVKEQFIIPVPVKHGKLDILGYRIGNLSYVTDASFIPEESMKLIKGSDVLIINALRDRNHPTHFNISEALEIAGNIQAKKTYFIHMTHDVLHSRDSRKLPANIEFAYDGLEISF